MGLSRSLQNAPNLGARALFAATLALALGLAGSLGCGSSSGGGGYNLGAVTPTWTHAMALVAVDPAVAVSPQGNALVAWNEITSHSVVKAQWLAAGASSISLSDPTLDSGAPAVATDGTGAAQVLWLQMDQTGGGVGHVWGRRWSGGSWSAAVQLSTNSFAYASNPQVACDGAGNALALWAEGSAINSNHFDLFAARFSGGSWSVPIRLSNGTNSTYSPRIAMNATGQAIAVWTQTEDDGSISNGPQDTWAVTFSANGTPATPVQLNTVSGATALATAPGSADLYGPKTVRAGMGAVFELPLFPEVRLADVLAALPGAAVYGLAAHEGTPLAAAGLRRPAVLVVGAERSGLSGEALAHVTDLVTIPLAPGLPGAVESLNAGVAGAIAVCYLFFR